MNSAFPLRDLDPFVGAVLRVSSSRVPPSLYYLYNVLHNELACVTHSAEDLLRFSGAKFGSVSFVIRGNFVCVWSFFLNLMGFVSLCVPYVSECGLCARM